MRTLLKQSTAVTVPIGPFVDSTDGDTEKTALSVTQSTVRLSKNGGTFAQKNDSSTSSHMENGYYACALNTTDTNTLGQLDLHVHISTSLMVEKLYSVVTANVYDTFFSTDVFDTSVTQVEGTALGTHTSGQLPADLRVIVGAAVSTTTAQLGVSAVNLGTQAKTDVNAEVVDALATDTYAEPGQGAPAATTSLVAKVNYLYKAWRNKKTQTGSAHNLYADDTTTIDQKTTVSDDGTTFTKNEITGGP